MKARVTSQRTVDFQQEVRARRARSRAVLTYRTRWDLLRSTDYRCTYCGGRGCLETGPDGRRWHFDHMVPLSRGGSPELENAAPCCWTCNGTKGTRTLDELVAWLITSATTAHRLTMRDHLLVTHG